MIERDAERIKELLKRAMGPLKEPELERDLWPKMLRRLDARPIRVPWFDWALLGLVLLWLFFLPQAIPALLYQL